MNGKIVSPQSEAKRNSLKMSTGLPSTFVENFHDELKVRQMEYINFGNTGLKVSKISLGGGTFSKFYRYFLSFNLYFISFNDNEPLFTAMQMKKLPPKPFIKL